MRKKVEYSMDDEVTQLMLETQNNTLPMYTNVSRYKDNSLVSHVIKENIIR